MGTLCGGRPASAVQLSYLLLIIAQKSYGMFVLHSYVRLEAVADRHYLEAATALHRSSEVCTVYVTTNHQCCLPTCHLNFTYL